MMQYYRDDPRWISTKFKGRCHRCGKVIKRGERAFYYPKGRHLFCDGPCGQAADTDFTACAQDEAACAR